MVSVYCVCKRSFSRQDHSEDQDPWTPCRATNAWSSGIHQCINANSVSVRSVLAAIHPTLQPLYPQAHSVTYHVAGEPNGAYAVSVIPRSAQNSNSSFCWRKMWHSTWLVAIECLASLWIRTICLELKLETPIDRILPSPTSSSSACRWNVMMYTLLTLCKLDPDAIKSILNFKLGLITLGYDTLCIVIIVEFVCLLVSYLPSLHKIVGFNLSFTVRVLWKTVFVFT